MGYLDPITAWICYGAIAVIVAYQIVQIIRSTCRS
jgi:hypothetical protein